MDNSEFLTDVTITKVYEGKSGEGQYGPWTAWNFYVSDCDYRFSYFSGGKKPKPTKGMKLKMLRFDQVTKDGYTNYNVKEMFIDNDPKPSQTKPEAQGSTISQNSSKDISFYVSYAKDLMVAAMSLNEDYGLRTLEDLGEIVVMVGHRMCNLAAGTGKPNTDPIEMPKRNNLTDVYEEPTFSEGSPLPEEPPF